MEKQPTPLGNKEETFREGAEPRQAMVPTLREGGPAVGRPASAAGTGGTCRGGGEGLAAAALVSQVRLSGRVSWPRTLGSASRPSSRVLPAPFWRVTSASLSRKAWTPLKSLLGVPCPSEQNHSRSHQEAVPGPEDHGLAVLTDQGRL